MQILIEEIDEYPDLPPEDAEDFCRDCKGYGRCEYDPNICTGLANHLQEVAEERNATLSTIIE